MYVAKVYTILNLHTCYNVIFNLEKTFPFTYYIISYDNVFVSSPIIRSRKESSKHRVHVYTSQ